MADRPNDNDDESLTIVEDDKDHETGGGAAAAGGGGGHEHQLQLHQQQRKARRRKSSVESGSTDYRFVTLNPHVSFNYFSTFLHPITKTTTTFSPIIQAKKQRQLSAAAATAVLTG